MRWNHSKSPAKRVWRSLPPKKVLASGRVSRVLEHHGFARSGRKGKHLNEDRLESIRCVGNGEVGVRASDSWSAGGSRVGDVSQCDLPGSWGLSTPERVDVHFRQ